MTNTMTWAKDVTYDLSPRIIFILLHIMVETPAGLNFILRPSYTLSSPSHSAHPVIRQYGILLLVSNALLGILLMDFCHKSYLVQCLERVLEIASSPEQTHINEQSLNRICGVLFLYHIAPFWRAISTFYDSQSRKAAYGGPLVVAVVHSVVGGGLLGVWLRS